MPDQEALLARAEAQLAGLQALHAGATEKTPADEQELQEFERQLDRLRAQAQQSDQQIRTLEAQPGVVDRLYEQAAIQHERITQERQVAAGALRQQQEATHQEEHLTAEITGERDRIVKDLNRQVDLLITQLQQFVSERQQQGRTSKDSQDSVSLDRALVMQEMSGLVAILEKPKTDRGFELARRVIRIGYESDPRVQLTRLRELQNEVGVVRRRLPRFFPGSRRQEYEAIGKVVEAVSRKSDTIASQQRRNTRRESSSKAFQETNLSGLVATSAISIGQRSKRKTTSVAAPVDWPLTWPWAVGSGKVPASGCSSSTLPTALSSRHWNRYAERGIPSTSP